MKKIGLTQRVEVIADYDERRDCLDQNWIKLLTELGYCPVPLPNLTQVDLVTTYLDELSLEGIILTGGNDLNWTKNARAAIERDRFETVLINHCCDKKIPVLGVCRGMQMLNIHFGGTLIKLQDHVCKNHPVKLLDGDEINVNSFHDWGISEDDLAPNLQALGHSEDGLVECLKHLIYPITAMMWHPERVNQDSHVGHQIIKETFL